MCIYIYIYIYIYIIHSNIYQVYKTIKRVKICIGKPY